jgi:hypothetical protein
MLDEGDIVNKDLTINHRALMEIAVYRANREFDAHVADVGSCPFTFRDLLFGEVARLEATAAVMIACRRGRAELESLSPQQRVIFNLEYRLTILRNGLSMPVDQPAIELTERMLAEARAALPNGPEIELADDINSANGARNPPIPNTANP